MARTAELQSIDQALRGLASHAFDPTLRQLLAQIVQQEQAGAQAAQALQAAANALAAKDAEIERLKARTAELEGQRGTELRRDD